MNAILAARLLGAALVLAAFAAMADTPSQASHAASGGNLRIAVTFDDLPWATLDRGMAQSGSPPVPEAVVSGWHRLLAAIVQARTPAIGFVNSGRLLIGGEANPERVAMLDAWLDAGLDLGSHTASHADLHAIGVEAYEQDILADDLVLRPIMQRHDLEPHWFRHPYLRTGRTLQAKAQLDGFLTAHGYRIAPVTITDSDWIWAAAYANAHAANDAEAQARLRREYVPYLVRMAGYFNRRSTVLLGYPLPQVLLLHANRLNADTYPTLVVELRRRGYRFVGLDEAMRDPAYDRTDEFTGELGTSWLNRWAMAAGRSWKFYSGTPTSPKWVVELAGVAPGPE